MHLKFGHNLMFTKKYGITSLNVMQKHIFIFSTHVEEYKPHVKNSNSRNYHTKNDITRKILISKENKKMLKQLCSSLRHISWFTCSRLCGPLSFIIFFKKKTKKLMRFIFGSVAVQFR